MDPLKHQLDRQQFQKKDDTSFSDKAGNSNGRLESLHIKIYEAVLLKIKSLEPTTGIQYNEEVDGNHMVVLKKCNILLDDKKKQRSLLKWEVSCQEKSKHRSHRPPANFSCLWLIYMIICLIKAPNIQGADTVTWEVNTQPVVFGQTLELLCTISSQENICDEYLRMWYGSKSDVLLCQNGKCRNKTKYSERKNGNCSFSLQIADLSIDDIDAYYTCSYGVSESKKKLMMKDFDFIKLPESTNISTSIQENSKILEIMVQINDVYPKPICTLTLQDRNFTGDTKATSIPDSKYLKLQVSIVYHVTPDDCVSYVKVECLIGKVTNIKKEQHLCSNGTTSNIASGQTTMIAAVLTVVLVILFGLPTVVFSVCYAFNKSRVREISRMEFTLFSTDANTMHVSDFRDEKETFI